MKTILHISKYYYPDRGGIETVAMYLAEGMTEYRNIVVCYSRDKSYHEEVIRGVRVYRIPASFSFMSQDVAFSYGGVLKRLFATYRPEYCHLHCPNPFVYPLVMRYKPASTKLILHWHSDILGKGLMYYLIRPFENRILRRADLIISTSPNYTLGSHQLLRHEHKVRVAQNGIITSLFTRRAEDDARIEAIHRQFKNKPIIFFVGRHIPYKGLDTLIRSERFIKGDCVVLIAGEGPQDGYLLSVPCSERVRFIGRVSDDELRCYLYAASIFAFPSCTKAEAFGVALAEAMYCNCAPVTCALSGSGINWVSLMGETGEQVAVGDARGLAAAIDRLLDNPDLRQHYADAAHQRVERMFTDRKAVEVMQSIYSSLE